MMPALTIAGAFLDPQLGHGSNVQKLETTATYFPDTQEFELHSPTTSATKWWIGGLGILATHSIVQAQLLLPEGNGKTLKNHGPHVFIMRSECRVSSDWEGRSIIGIRR